MLSLHAYLAGGKLYGYSFCKKPIFSYNKGIYFNLTIMVVETLGRYNPNSIPIKVVNNPTILIKSDEILRTLQVLDTQDCPEPGTRLTMIRLYTLQRFAHFSPQDSIASVGFLALQGV